MKIKSIHINNYGKLSNYDLSFNNITTICEENGFGKSTISSFIKSMFYGLETTKGSSFSERQHFYPFSGGKFGGNIKFEYKGKEYRIERTFDIKKEALDTLTVYENNNLTNDLGSIPGETIFGINKNSFERLISINADKINIEGSSDINKKLNNYAENVSEDFDIDKVISRIKEKNIRANKAEIKNTKEEIDSLSITIRNEEKIKESLDARYKQLTILERNKQQAQKQYEQAVALKNIIDNWKTYDGYLNDVNETKEKMKNLNTEYPNGFPNYEELKDVETAYNDLNVLNSVLSKPEISQEKLDEFNDLKSKFKDYLPDESEIANYKQKVDDYKKCIDEIRKYENSTQDSKELELEPHFKGTDISKEKIETIEKEVNREKELENELLNIKQTIIVSETQVQEEKKKANLGLFIALLIISLALVGVGIAFIGKILVLGIALLAVGIIVLFLNMFIYFTTALKNVKKETLIPVEKPNPEYESKSSELKDQKYKLKNIFAHYRYDSDDPYYIFVNLKNDYEAYTKILNDKEEAKNEYEKNKLIENSISNELNEYFAKFDMQSSSYENAIDDIKFAVPTYKRLEKEISESQEKRKSDLEKKNKIESYLIQFRDKYLISETKSVNDIKLDINTYKQLGEDYIKQDSKAKTFFKENGLSEKPEMVEYDIESLKNANENHTSEYVKFKEQIENDESIVDNLDELKNQYSNLEEKQKELRNKETIYNAIKDNLLAADQTLKDKYIKPIKDKFSEYAELIEKTLNQNISMNKNYEISFDIEGELRTSNHLSSGMYSICALCFRLAIFDNMFSSDKPFIILDDPFTSLDEGHIEKVKELITNMSGDRQIIYFTCHESRKI